MKAPAGRHIALSNNIENPLPHLTGKAGKWWMRYSWAAVPLLFATLSFTWSRLTINTWDDDAITRYMLVKNAGANPHVFLESWVRPLFALLFYLPVHFFGRAGVAVTMTLLSAASACLLYKSIRKDYPQTAVLVMPCLLFQTFLFGISRDAMTEPLASCIISLGIYLYRRKNYGWFAVIGSLLPLARTETVLLLPFWAIALAAAKKYPQILLLGLGLLAWFMGLLLYTGDFFAFFHELLQSGDKANRYAHNPPAHHFFKYIYVIGPVLFYFFVLGLIVTVKAYFRNQFIILQFIAGFLMYVFFSAYYDLGQSGGALRNLVTLSPFAAMIAFLGIDYWLRTIAAPTAMANDRTFKKTIIGVYSIFLSLLGVQLFTGKLILRQFYDESEKDYTIYFYLLATLTIVIISLLSKLSKKVAGYIAAALMVLQLVFTLSFERPDSHSNNERIAMGSMAKIIESCSLYNSKIVANHPWLFWALDLNMGDTVLTGRLQSETFKKLKAGEIVVWDNHYNSERYTDLNLVTLQADISCIPLIDIVDEEAGFMTILFIKAGKDNLQTQRIFDKLLAHYPDNAKLYYYAARFRLFAEKKYVEVIPLLNRALQLDSHITDVWYMRGICYLNSAQKSAGCADLMIAARYGNAEAKKLLDQYCR